VDQGLGWGVVGRVGRESGLTRLVR
jgi:hypothetical protein